MLNINELRESIKRTALDKTFFPQMGERIPRLYEQTRALIREWRDENRIAIEAALGRLRADIAHMQPEPVSDIERALRRAFDMDPDAPDSHGA